MLGRALVLLACLLFAAIAHAEEPKPLRGVALIIGQSDYEHLGKLPNPGNDARAIEAMLSDLGFETDVASDRDARRLKRDLEGFVEDAEGADVALIYYSGHGIEAGGENWLVPVDADVASLDDAGEKLVPLSSIVAELKAEVPVTIVLLDACRNDPFPPGSLLKAKPGDLGKPIAAGGLGESRGAAPLMSGPKASADNSLGQVIGFAAEPGKVALDGPAGGNSPYAAAILRHLGALSGDEFGTVLRMVGEEVYLKTGGKQRPWVNESLRRLLYFGGAAPMPSGEEGDILMERRRLLLVIAGLPASNRARVERVAAGGGVPMDALYGMLRVLGSNVPGDPGELERLLRSQTETLKERLAERDELKRQSDLLRQADPEIVRLSALIDEAIAQGALETAKALHDRAKARVRELLPALQRDADDLGARFAEAAQVYARSGEDSLLAFDYDKAAADYAEAYSIVEPWNQHLAWKYKNQEAIALIGRGKFLGGEPVLEEAAAAARLAIEISQRFPSKIEAANSRHQLCRAEYELGWRRPGTKHLTEAVTNCQAAIADLATGQQAASLDLAMTQRDLGDALYRLGRRTGDAAPFEAANAAWRAALEHYTQERFPADWAVLQNNVGRALSALGYGVDGDKHLAEALAPFTAAQREWTPERDRSNWAVAENNRAGVLQAMGLREAGTTRLQEAMAAYRAAKRIGTDLDGAHAENQIGNILRTLGEREGNVARFEEAIAAHRAAQAIYTRDLTPTQWADFENDRGRALLELGNRSEDTARLKEAVAAFREASAELARDRGRLPLNWASAEANLGSALQALGIREYEVATLDAAVSAYRASLEEYPRDRLPAEFAWVQDRLGDTLIELGRISMSPPLVEQGKQAIIDARDAYVAAGYDAYDVAPRLAAADQAIEIINGGERVGMPR